MEVVLTLSIRETAMYRWHGLQHDWQWAELPPSPLSLVWHAAASIRALPKGRTRKIKKSYQQIVHLSPMLDHLTMRTNAATIYQIRALGGGPLKHREHKGYDKRECMGLVGARPTVNHDVVHITVHVGSFSDWQNQNCLHVSKLEVAKPVRG
jgi:hypothetical protein